MNFTLNGSTTWTVPHIVTQTDIINLTVHGLCGLLGIISNGVTIAIILNGKRFGQGMKIQLINLAVVDFLCALLCPISGFIGGIVTINYFQSNILCVLHQFLTTVFFCNSLYCTVAMAIERFVAVFYPLKIHTYSRRGVIIVILIGWISSFGLHVDIILFSAIHNIPEFGNIRMCLSRKASKNILWRLVNILRFLLPVAILLFCYISIGFKLVRRKTIGERHMYSGQKKNHQVLIMLAVVGILATVTWSPYMLPSLISNFTSEVSAIREPTVSNMIFYTLMLSNCFSANLVYLIFSKDYKMDMKQELLGIKKQKRPSAISTDTRSRLSTLSELVSARPTSRQGTKSL
ncbi:tachykinin-like peptides receptor 86C [Watersipora subatra]|uniref:tachykinin-like peptides receptor 86C n=1 Tax=Watersipora subatra TaxID=2589382 RepID=UPI00355BA028